MTITRGKEQRVSTKEKLAVMYGRFSVFTKKNRSADTWSFTVHGSCLRPSG